MGKGVNRLLQLSSQVYSFNFLNFEAVPDFIAPFMPLT